VRTDGVPRELNKVNPSQDYVGQVTLQRVYFSMGVGVRKGAFDLLQWVNTFVFTARAGGELNALHKKYLGIDSPELPSL
jgi:polar amino acid transport system substrate-binding protein